VDLVYFASTLIKYIKGGIDVSTDKRECNDSVFDCKYKLPLATLNRETAINAIKSQRAEYKYTQSQMAKLLHVTQPDISNFENDKWERISLRVLVRILDWLELMLCFIPFEEGYMHRVIIKQRTWDV